MFKTTTYLSFLILSFAVLGCSKNNEILVPSLDFGFKITTATIVSDEEIQVPTYRSIQLVNTSINVTSLNNLIWNLGDGTISKDVSPIVNFSEAAVYRIELLDANYSTSSKHKNIKVVDRYTETVQLELSDLRNEVPMSNTNQESISVILRIFEPFIGQNDANTGKLVFESAPQFVTGIGKEIRSFLIPTKTATIVPLEAPINKQYVYRIYVRSGEKEQLYLGNDPKLGGYSFYEDNFTKDPEMKIFGSKSIITVVGKYDSFQ